MNAASSTLLYKPWRVSAAEKLRNAVGGLRETLTNQPQRLPRERDVECDLRLASASRKQCGNAGRQQRSQVRSGCKPPAVTGPCTDSLQQVDFGRPCFVWCFGGGLRGPSFGHLLA